MQVDDPSSSIACTITIVEEWIKNSLVEAYTISYRRGDLGFCITVYENTLAEGIHVEQSILSCPIGRTTTTAMVRPFYSIIPAGT